jgi:hypothetical protein
MSSYSRIRFLSACLALSGAAAGASAQDAGGGVEQLERQLEQIRRDTRLQVVGDVPAAQRALVDYGAYFTAGYLSLEDSIGDTHILRQYDLVPYGRVNFDGVHDFYLRGRFAYRDFHSGDSFDGDDDGFEGELEEGYYRFDLSRYFAAYGGKAWDDQFAVTAGRQFTEWATGLTLSQYADGVNIDADFGNLGVRLLAGLTVPDTVDFDTSRPDFDDDTSRAFFGGMASLRLGKHRPFAYALVQRDENDDDPLAVGPIQTRFGYDSYYVGIGSTGALTDRLIYGAELVYEGGEGLSNSFDNETFDPVAQSEEDINAWAAQLTLDYVPPDRFRSRFGAGVILASGDDDRGRTSDTFAGNASGTDDNAFNALGLLDTGLAFAPEISNIVIVRGTASAYPFPNGGAFREFQCGVDLFAYGKMLHDAPIDEPTRNDVFLGIEPDLFVNWSIVEDVILSVRYGVFFPGEAIPDRDPRQFLYAAITYSF